MKASMKRELLLILMVILGAILPLGDQAVSWTIADLEIRDLSGSFIVRDYEGKKKFSLQFIYLNDRSMSYIWGAESVEEIKKLIGDRKCLFLAVFVSQDSYFYPTNITFVQEGLQYDIRYEDVIKISDTFSGYLRAGVKALGFIFIPEPIDIYSPMKIYYDDDWTIFSVPKMVQREEEKELDIDEQIRKLEREKAKLEKEIEEAKKRIMEIDQKIEKLMKQREKDKKKQEGSRFPER